MKSTFTKLVALLALVAMMFALASCDLFATPEEEHEHTYSDKWTSDATNHWKVATCADGDECKTAIAEKAAHTLSGDKCSVCGWTKPADPKPEDPKPETPAPHEHTYATEWSKDDTNHWYAATCNAEESCASAKKDKAAHDFTAGNTCVCGETHTHTFATEYSKNDTHHWFEVSCNVNDTCAAAKAEAAHDFTNGDCVCGKEAPAPALGTIGNPIALTIPGTANVSLEADGVVYYTFTITENKTLKVTLDSDNADIACGTNINELFDMLDGEAEDSVIETSLVAGTYYVAFATADFAADEYTVSAEFVNKVSPYEAVIVAGTNNVMFSAAEVAADAATRTVRITEAGNYKFAAGNLYIASVTDASGNAVTKNADYTYTLAAGDYTIGFSMLSIFSVAADTPCELNVEKQAVVDDDNVIGKIEGENVTFTYTATEEGVLTVTLSSAMGGPVDVTFAHGTVSGSIMAGGDSVEIKLKKDEVVTFTVVSDGGTATLTGEWEAKVWDTGLPEGTVDITTLAGAGTSAAPWVITGAGVYYMPAVNAWPGQFITFTATENISITFTSDVSEIYAYEYNGYGYTTSASPVAGENEPYKVNLVAGKTVILNIVMYTGTSDVLLTVETSEYVPESDDELVVGETAEVYVEEDSTTEVTFTINEAGTYIVTVLTENGQLANIRFPDTVLENPLTVAFTEAELADFDGSYTIHYLVSTTDGVAGYVNIKVEKQTAQEPSDDPITGTGSEDDPFVINGAGSVLISASYGMPVCVTVPAGFTASLDCAAQFFTSEMEALGTSVTPTATTTYMIFSDSMAGCMGMLTATAAQASVDPITGTGSEDDPFVINGAGSVLISASYGMPVCVTVPAGFTASLDCAAQFFTSEMEALGTSVTPTATTTYMIFSDSMAGCMGQLTAAEAQAEDDSNKLVVGDNAVNVTVQNFFAASTIVTFTATEAGTYVINAADGETNADVYIFEGDWCELPYSFTLAAGETITFDVRSLDIMSTTEDVINLVITKSEGTGGDEEEEKEEITTSGYLDEGETSVTITDEQHTAGKVYYAFTPWNEGAYYFWSGDLYVSGVYLNGEALSTNDDGHYVLSSYVQYVVEITCSWAPSAGTYTVNADYQYPEGRQENPIWIYSDAFGTNLTANYPGNYQTVWYTFYASANGTVTVTTENATATIFITAVFGSEVESVDGTVSLTVMQGRQYYIGVADFTCDENWVNPAAEITFTPTFTEGEYVGDGTQNMPNLITLGANTASVPKYGCVWFAYKATANGTLTVSTENAVCAWYFQNQDLYATAGDKTIQIEEGSIVYLYIETSDSSEADIAFTASFKADPVASYFEGTVAVDGTANAVEIADNTWTILSFNGAGQYTIAWDNTDAVVYIYDWMTYSNVAVTNGAVINGSNWGNELTVYLPDYAAGTVNLTITPYVAETTTNTLVLGENAISVPAGQTGVNYTFTSVEGGAYTLSAAEGEENAFVFNVSGSEATVLPYSFTLGANETIEFNITAYDYSEDEINLVLTEVVA